MYLHVPLPIYILFAFLFLFSSIGYIHCKIDKFFLLFCFEAIFKPMIRFELVTLAVGEVRVEIFPLECGKHYAGKAVREARARA